MAEGIRIDDLTPTAVPGLLHEFPAMKDGLTVKLTLAQVQALMLTGANNVGLALKDLSNAVGPRGKYADSASPNADLDTRLENGLWVVGTTAPNSPIPGSWGLLRVEADGLGSGATQYLCSYLNDQASDSKVYKRENNAGVWGSWYRVRENEAELDARYMRSEPGDLVLTWKASAPAGCFKANGAAVAIATYGALDAAIYCGNTLNPTAAWGYRCTNPANPTGSRSTAGTHIVLPDARGEFLRGWIDDRTLLPETGRNQFTLELDAFQDHLHQMSRSSSINLAGGGSSDVYRSGSEYLNGLSVATGAGYRTAAETRPRNLTPLICIRYAY